MPGLSAACAYRRAFSLAGLAPVASRPSSIYLFALQYVPISSSSSVGPAVSLPSSMQHAVPSRLLAEPLPCAQKLDSSLGFSKRRAQAWYPPSFGCKALRGERLFYRSFNVSAKESSSSGHGSSGGCGALKKEFEATKDSLAEASLVSRTSLQEEAIQNSLLEADNVAKLLENPSTDDSLTSRGEAATSSVLQEEAEPVSFTDEFNEGRSISVLESNEGNNIAATTEAAETTESTKSAPESSHAKLRTRPDRKKKGGLFTRSLQGDVPDLLTVPGIGPKNLEKLVAKGIGKVAELKQLYRDKFLNETSGKMVEYLQNSVGIVHKNHAERITSYVKHCVDEELKNQSDSDKESCSRQKKKVTICVEGNISVGKTTFLQRIANETIELRDLVEIVPEPVDKWKDVGPDHFNLLDAFYNEPERYAYTFQNYVFATRLMKEQETARGIKPLRLMERSIFSDRLVFVRAVHEAKWMSELELRIYESWFDPFISALPGLVPDGFIYLRASPDTCLQRLHMRNRPEERGVTLEYLRGLHEKHEQCFFPSDSSGGVLSVSRWPFGPHKLPPPPMIRDRVVYLEGEHLHSSIRKVPALILDCEATIDFNRDLDARAEYAKQVAEFCEYIQSNKDFDVNKASQNGTVNPFVLPHSGGFLRPDGCPILPGHSLNAFDFTKHSSAFMS